MTADLNWLQTPIAAPDAAATEAAQARQAQLTKPAGALGELETVAIRLAGLQRRECPRVDRVHIAVFAADHGVAEEGISAFPQAVTAQMVDNFATGGAAISVLARQLGATLEVIDLGTVGVSQVTQGVRRERIAASTANLARGPAMTVAQLALAVQSGREAALRASETGAELFIGGEMGIGNTTAATAMACALLGMPAAALAGRGTGLDEAGLAHKIAVIDRALALHGLKPGDAVEVLRCCGGFEIAALAGAYIACAQLGVAVLVDGFITSAAALAAVRIAPGVADWMLFAHQSAEAGHAGILQALQARPLLQLGLRLGEGSGAAIAVPLLRLSCAVHGEMATFGSAGVSNR